MRIPMSTKEINQVKIFERLRNNNITQIDAASMLDLTPRQVRKKYKRYLEEGEIGLLHKNTGRANARKFAKAFIDKIINFAKTCYQGYGPTLMAEELEVDENIKISVESLRQLLILNGFWSKHRKRNPHRQRRPRKEHKGMLVQVDASLHNWFGEDYPKCVIVCGIDDATGEIMFLEFHKTESTKSYMLAFKNYIKKYGRPLAIYVDFHGVFHVNLNNPEGIKETQFGRAMQELDIEIVYAHSPQAKGRIERLNGILQDRLVKFLRKHKITDIASANKLIAVFISHYNKKFSKQTANQRDLHRPSDGFDLDGILCIKEERILANDYTILWHKRVFQLRKYQPAIIRPKNKILVQEKFNGNISLKIRNTILNFYEIGQRNIGKLSPIETVNLANAEETEYTNKQEV